eukprot:7921843-Pyramimonas_sp.AAC.1
MKIKAAQQGEAQTSAGSMCCCSSCEGLFFGSDGRANDLHDAVLAAEGEKANATRNENATPGDLQL